MLNKISFKLSTETFGCDNEPTDVVEIYIDGDNLRKKISYGLPLWPSELYTSLMRSFFLEDEPVNIFVCGCGCVGCGDTEVHIDETERLVIWHDFIHDSKTIEFNQIFVFDREQYYSEVNKILEWVGDTRLVHYLGNVFTVWSDELRLRYLADNLSCSCALRYDFKSEIYFGREEVLNALKLEFAEGAYKQKETQNFFYRIGGFHRRMKAKGYSDKYLELYHHESPTEAVMHVFYNTDSDGKINDILLRRGHSSQLDILAQDSKGRYFNVEVQRSDEGAPARRARFYSSILDTHFLQPGKLYEELPDTYVIFITENDVLRDNLPLYNIRRRIDENAKCFEDGSHIIYVNSQRRDDTALGKLMQDLYCTEPKNLHYHEFAERMEFLKYSKEGEEKMTDVIEEYAAKKAEAVAKEAAREAVKEKNIEFAKGLLADGMSIEFTVRHSKLSEAEVRELASKLTA